jgi:RNA polymerase sigma factor (sigma-70 family)
VKIALNSLSEGYRQVLRLKYIEGLSVAQIATRLDLSLKAVESRLSRARLAFREVWDEETQKFY